jgi:uncharacterized protein
MVFDPLMMLLMLPGILLGMYAQMRLQGTYGKWSQVGTSMTGADAARVILDRSGLAGMPVNVVPGRLTDHYDPMKKALFLSEENYHGNSVAAVGVAAHEAGHALQHKAAYFPLHLRMALVPVTNIATNAAAFLFLIGFVIGMAKWAMAGLIIFAIITFFHLVTLPVEFDASRRAKAKLVELGIIRADESGGVSKVLNAAAMTYVAALVTSALQLLYFFLRVRSMNDDRS